MRVKKVSTIAVIVLLSLGQFIAEVECYNDFYLLKNWGFEDALIEINPDGTGYWMNLARRTDEAGLCEGESYAILIEGELPNKITQCFDVASYAEKTFHIQYMAKIYSDTTSHLGISIGYSSKEDDFVISDPPTIMNFSPFLISWQYYDFRYTLGPNTNNKPLICMSIEGFYLFETGGSGGLELDDVIMVEETAETYLITDPSIEAYSTYNQNFPSNWGQYATFKWYRVCPETNSFEGKGAGTPCLFLGNSMGQCFPKADILGKTVRVQFLQGMKSNRPDIELLIQSDTTIYAQKTFSNLFPTYFATQQDATFIIPEDIIDSIPVCVIFKVGGTGVIIDNLRISIISDVGPCATVICEDTDEDFCTDYICVDGECKYVEHNCDDGLLCTDDSCHDNQCFHDINCAESTNCEDVTCGESTKGECMYTSTCITTDECNPGVCTDNTCNFGPLCVDEDGDFCKDYICDGESCITVDHVCEDDGLECTTESCYANECHSDINCEDYKNCSEITCDKSTEGKCVYTSTCNSDACHAAQCVENECLTKEVCPDDGDPCTINTCSEDGSCLKEDRDCDDGNLCTVDKCSKSRKGCYYEDYNCDDGDYCTTDTCDKDSKEEGSQCIHTDITCDDRSYCTIDTCEKSKGCVFSRIECDDENVCTVNLCDVNDSDGDPCYFLDKEPCNDGNRCTTDYCDPIVGCKNDIITCNDSSVCTIDTCDRLRGCQFTPISCDDNNDCTIDSCDTLEGCKHIQSTVGICAITNCVSNGDCDDNNKCTIDTCSNSLCTLTPVDCNDANRCTLDTCTPTQGCIHNNIGGSCSSNTGGSTGGSTLGSGSDARTNKRNLFTDRFFDRF